MRSDYTFVNDHSHPGEDGEPTCGIVVGESMSDIEQSFLEHIGRVYAFCDARVESHLDDAKQAITVVCNQRFHRESEGFLVQLRETGGSVQPRFIWGHVRQGLWLSRVGVIQRSRMGFDPSEFLEAKLWKLPVDGAAVVENTT